MMLDSDVWWAFYASPFPFLVLCILLSTQWAVLNSQSQPFFKQDQFTHNSHVRCSEADRLPLAQGERVLPSRLQYTRAELLGVAPTRLNYDLTHRLHSLEIGVGLPRKRYRQRKKRCKHNHLKVLYLNSQSCDHKAIDINE